MGQVHGKDKLENRINKMEDEIRRLRNKTNKFYPIVMNWEIPGDCLPVFDSTGEFFYAFPFQQVAVDPFGYAQGLYANDIAPLPLIYAVGIQASFLYGTTPLDIRFIADGGDLAGTEIGATTAVVASEARPTWHPLYPTAGTQQIHGFTDENVIYPVVMNPNVGYRDLQCSIALMPEESVDFSLLPVDG